MGLFKDLFTALKATVTGLVPLGGTLIPTTDSFPVALAHNIKGGYAPYDTLDQLADVPYENLLLDMEVSVKAYTGHPRTRYRLKQMPPANTRISEMGGANILDFWESLTVDSEDPEAGNDGFNGWSPALVLEGSGDGITVMRLVGYHGGTGAPPSIDPAVSYLSAAGLVVKANASNLKGPKGVAGDSLQVRPMAYFSAGTRPIATPSTTLSLPMGDWKDFPAEYNLNVINTWGFTRMFMVHAQMPFANDSGSDSLVAQLVTGSGPAVLDEAYKREDYVGSSPKPSVAKIDLWYMLEVPKNQSAQVRVRCTQSNGGACKISNPFIEAWGL